MGGRDSRRRARLVVAVGLAVLAVAAATLAIVVSGGDPEVDPTPTTASAADRCRTAGGHPEVQVTFVNATADDEMRLAAETLRDDPRVAEIDERTREQAYDLFKRLYADNPEMLETARLEAMPASLLIRPADDLTPERLAEDLRTELTTADSVDAIPCVTPAPPT